LKNILLSGFLIGSLSFAQIDGPKSIEKKSLYAYQPGTPGTRIVGSPSEVNNFKMGTINGNGIKELEARMRYNANEEVLEYVDNGNIKKELPSQPHNFVAIDGKE
jgi:hypothetical protein